MKQLTTTTVPFDTVSLKTLSRLRDAVAPQSLARISGSDSTRVYRDLIEQRLGKKSFAGLGLPDLPQQSLEAIFVPPEAIRRQRSEPSRSECDEDAMAACVARDRYGDAIRKNEKLDVEEAIHAIPRLMILGCPGSGKTTLLQYAAVQTARGDYFQQDCLPVFIRLPEFAAALEMDASIDFLAWIKARASLLGSCEIDGIFDVWLEDESKQLLFLLDGLDEVPDEKDRAVLVAATKAFVTKYPKNRFCVTSRPIGFDSSPWEKLGFEVIWLLEYGPKQIRKTIEKWSPLLEPGQTDGGTEIDLEHLATDLEKPIAVVAMPFRDEQADSAYILNYRFFKADPRAWQAEAERLLNSNDTSIEIRKVIILHMATQSDVQTACLARMEELLRGAAEEELKLIAISGLARCVVEAETLTELLKSLVRESPVEAIRAEAAWALGGAVEKDSESRELLRNILFDVQQPEEVRRNAAFGITNAVEHDGELMGAILQLAENDASKSVRLACLQALRKCVATCRQVRDAFLDWAKGDGMRSRVACQILGRALVDGKPGDDGWDDDLCKLVEEGLRRVGSVDGLGSPCPHLLRDLRALVDARESRGGVRLEETLAEALESLSDVLDYCFVFGSTAKHKQSDESDIDVMLIGEVTMDIASPLLKNAERNLGRQINPTVYSLTTFRKKLHGGDHFVHSVVREPKLPVRIGNRLLSQEDLNHELRTMEAERMVNSQ